jgi:nucleoside-diphosphate-sugar epimerase
MRIFLTGATGFIGSHVLHQLLASDAEVVLPLRPGSNRWRIPKQLPSNISILEGDLLYFEQIKPYLLEFRPNLFLHLAWYTEHGVYWNSLKNLEMVNVTLSLIRFLARLEETRFIGPGTCVEYDVRSASATHLNESEFPVKPQSAYAASKLAVAQILEQVSQHSPLQAAWLRVFYLYGPMEDPRRLVPLAINHFIDSKILNATQGTKRRDYLHVEDVASAILSAAFGNKCGVINIGSGQAVSIRQLLETIARQMNAEHLLNLGALPNRADDPPLICADNQRLRSTGWQPSYTLATGLQQTIKWWQAESTGPT